jgi:hypothetical protein
LTKFDISNCEFKAEGGKALAAGLKGNQVITELNISENDLGLNSDYSADTSGIVAIADAIPDMGALSVLNLASNNLGELVLPDGWSVIRIAVGSTHSIQMYGHADGREQKDHPGKPEGVIAIANAIPDMRALSHFDISNNGLYAAGARAIAEGLSWQPGLKGNPVVELNISGNDMGKISQYGSQTLSGVAALANVIPGMGALSKLIFGGDGKVHDGNDWVSPEPATLELGITEANFNNKNLGAGGAIVISAWITHKDNGALIKLDISNNYIGAEQKGGLQRICVASGIDLAM